MDHSSSLSLSPQPPPEEEELDLPSSHPARRSEFGGKNETKRGWGESMELAHQRDNKQNKHKTSSVVAVDLGQFRNTEVGKGYQAKHVVRQKMATTTKTKTRTVNDNFDVQKRKQSETKTKSIDTKELLNNDGLRAFRREIESILSSS